MPHWMSCKKTSKELVSIHPNLRPRECETGKPKPFAESKISQNGGPGLASFPTAGGREWEKGLETHSPHMQAMHKLRQKHQPSAKGLELSSRKNSENTK